MIERTKNARQDEPERAFHNTVVGIAGFEPTTSASRRQRSTKLSYIPILMLIFVDVDQLGWFDGGELYASKDAAQPQAIAF